MKLDKLAEEMRSTFLRSNRNNPVRSKRIQNMTDEEVLTRMLFCNSCTKQMATLEQLAEDIEVCTTIDQARTALEACIKKNHPTRCPYKMALLLEDIN